MYDFSYGDLWWYLVELLINIELTATQKLYYVVPLNATTVSYSFSLLILFCSLHFHNQYSIMEVYV